MGWVGWAAVAVCGAVVAYGVCTTHFRDDRMRNNLLFGFVLLFVAVLVAMFVEDDASEVAQDLLVDSVEKSAEVFVEVFRYVAPFALYPLIIYWLKVLSSIGSECQHLGNPCNRDSDALERAGERRLQQTRVVTWVVKVLILVFVLFAVLSSLGIETSDVVQITSIFSLGLSWSMSDWLKGLWACFMIAFSTELASDSIIAVGGDTQTCYKVISAGLVFVTCRVYNRSQGESKGLEIVYIPNSTLFQQGFRILA